MSTYVLVHGSWHGGWAWRWVAPLLRSWGHVVFTPTLTGLGERSHLLTNSINLSLHIQDIVNLLEFEDLENVVLVGHSYSGLVIGGATEVSPARICHLAFLDAIVPAHQKSGFDVMPEIEPLFRQLAAVGGVGLVPPFSPEDLGVTDSERAEWMRLRLVPMPIATHEEKLKIPQERFQSLPRTFIRCSLFPRFQTIAEMAQASGFTYQELPTGHDAMVIDPDAVARVLHSLS